MAATALSHAYPLGTRVNEQGHLEVGGCDVVELAERYGTPAYIYAEDDMRARARAYIEAFEARTDDFEVIYASKALPLTGPTGCWRRRGCRWTWRPVASCTSR